MKNSIKKWGWYIFLVLFAIGLYIFAIYLKLPEESLSNVFQYLINDKVGKEITIYFTMSLAQLLFVIVFVKVLLAQRAFLEAIYEHFKTIFIEKSVIPFYNQEELTNIVKEVDKVHPGISVSYDELRHKSIQALENKLIHKKPYIITNYQNTDTIYSKKYEIKHKKIFFKMVKDDDFSYSYFFIPFDKIIKPNDYKINNTSRWDNKSFKFFAKGINTPEKEIEIEAEFSIDNDNGKEWIKIKFINKSNRYKKLKKGDEFLIEFSISSPIDLSNTAEAIQRRKEYFTTNYSIPCAVRSVKFQIETYSDEKLDFEPVIKINNSPNRVEPIENIYYKTWYWEFYYSENIEKKINISIEKNQS